MLAARFVEKRPGARLLLPLWGLVALSMAGVPPAVAQVAAPPAPKVTQPQPKRIQKKAKETQPPPPDPTVPVPATAPNLFDQPALPATVSTANNELTVSANNSSLVQILHQVASKTGMQLDGLGGDERVFGSFGPGTPREVLTALLNGTSYNVVMVGDLPNGAPRELLLTHRAGGSATNPPVNAAQNQTPGNPNGENGDDASQDDSANSDDSTDDAPPMQYTPPSIAPAEPPPPGQNTRPGPVIQNRPE